MKFDTTSVIALAAVIAPIIVAIINNYHQRKMRKLELRHDMMMYKFDILYDDKKKAFSDFLLSAGKLCLRQSSSSCIEHFLSCSQIAMMYANRTNRGLINNFSQNAYTQDYQKFKDELAVLTIALNEELSELQLKTHM